MDTSLSKEQYEAWAELYSENYDEEKHSKQLTLGHIDLLIDCHKLNNEIKEITINAARHYINIIREADDAGDYDTSQATIPYLKTCKELIDVLNTDNIRLTNEVKQLRSEPYGKKKRRQ